MALMFEAEVVADELALGWNRARVILVLLFTDPAGL